MIQVTNIWDVLCNFCILIMEHMCHMTGLSYGLLNILLFVVLGPSVSVLFFGAALCFRTRKPQWSRWGNRLLAAGSIIALAVAGLIVAATLTTPFH